MRIQSSCSYSETTSRGGDNGAVLTDKKITSLSQGTLPKALDFNSILTMDLKELTPDHKTSGYKYILYMVLKVHKGGADPKQRSRHGNYQCVQTIDCRYKRSRLQCTQITHTLQQQHGVYIQHQRGILQLMDHLKGTSTWWTASLRRVSTKPKVKNL